MPNSSLCCHLCKCQSPHCLLLVHLLLVNPLIALSSLSMPISSVPISSLPSHPCPSLPFPDLCLCTSPHCPIISSIHISLLMPIWFLLYLFLMMQILTALFSRLSVVDFLKFHCAKWNEKKVIRFIFFSRKMKDHECQSSVKMESTSVNMRTAKWRLCMMLSKGEQEYQVRTWNR